MEPKILKKRRLRFASAAAVTVASAAAMLATFALPSASSAKPARAAAGSVLTMESSPENSITQDFNADDSIDWTCTGAYSMGVDSLIYEPLLQFNLSRPSQAPYYFLATAYKWGAGGKSITFTIAFPSCT